MRILGAAILLSLFALPVHAFPSPVSGSYYHQRFEGRPMACGGRFDNENLTAASNHHPCGTPVRVSYRGRSVDVLVTDRCGRCGIDLSRAAAREIGMLRVGRAPVRVERLDAAAAASDEPMDTEEHASATLADGAGRPSEPPQPGNEHPAAVAPEPAPAFPTAAQESALPLTSVEPLAEAPSPVAAVSPGDPENQPRIGTD